MRSFDAVTQAYLAGRQGLVSHFLIWVAARTRDTQAVEGVGLWSGDYPLTLTLEGEARTYLGAGELLAADPITSHPGLEVRTHQLRLAAVSAEVEALVKGYDTRFARVEVHRALFDPTGRFGSSLENTAAGEAPGLLLDFAGGEYFSRASEQPWAHAVGSELPALLLDFAGGTYLTNPRAPWDRTGMAGAPHRVFRGFLNSIEFPRGTDGGAPACVLEVASETRALTRTLAVKKSDDSHQARGGDRFRRYGDVSGAVPVYWGEIRAEAAADPAPSAATPTQTTTYTEAR